MESVCSPIVLGFFIGNIPKAEEKNNDENETNDAARDGGPDHGEGNLSRSVLDFVGHVKYRVVSTDGKDDRQQAYAPLHTFVFPATLAVKGGFENKV